MVSASPTIHVVHGSLPDELQHTLRHYDPRTDLGRVIKRVAHLLPRHDALELLDTVMRSVVMESSLALVHWQPYERTERACDHAITQMSETWGVCRKCHIGLHRLDYGVVSRRVVTTAYVNLLVDDLQTSQAGHSAFEDHGYGTGTTAAVIGDTDIETEFTTEYASDNTRPEGSQEEGASANIYKSIATFSPDTGGTLAVTEHGLLNDPTVGSGTLLDRHVFSAVNVVAAADSLQSTYQLTCSAGG